MEEAMEETIQAIASHLRARREKDDPVSQARRAPGPDQRRVLEVLDRVRLLLVDGVPDDRLESELEVVHGLLASVVGAKAGRVLARIPEMRHCVAMDVEAALQGDPAAKSYGEIVASYPSILAVTTYRLAHALYEVGEPVIARIMAEDAHSRTGIDIHPGATIGCYFFIDHGTGVVIGETAEIGNRVKLYNGVTLAAFSTRKGQKLAGVKRHPTVEDDVTIYANASILGGETVVGRCSVIGANVFLTRSVPPYTKVMIEPPKLQMIREAERAASRDWEI
jgi:serine O-acetyltransferase